MTRYINKVLIKDNEVIKKTKRNLKELFSYLDEVEFINYPKIIEIEDRIIKTEYIKSIKNREIIKGKEFIKTVATLHKNTMIYKDVSKNKYKKIHKSLMENIEYLKEYYNSLIEEIEYKEFMSPKEYLFARNYSIILATLNKAESTLNKWLKIVETKSKERVCTLHNNLTLKHFIKGDKNYLISWDNYTVDTPILDLYKFYKKEGFQLEFRELLNAYEEINRLTEEETLLLKSLMLIPPKIQFLNDEYLSTIYLKDSFSYIYSSVNITIENK